LELKYRFASVTISFDLKSINVLSRVGDEKIEVIRRSGRTLGVAFQMSAAWAQLELTTPPKTYLVFLALPVPSAGLAKIG